MAAHPTELPPLPLPEGIIETYVKTNDLIFHVLSAGTPGQPLILCLHGFLGLAWSWHEIMPLLAMGGYHVIAYDQRGYGRTTGWDTRSWSEVDLHTFTFQRLVIDAERLVMALGYTKVTMVLGHGFGSVVANLCALIRPDIFKSVITASHPNPAIPLFPFNTNNPTPSPPLVSQALASLPEPRKCHTDYYSTEQANNDLMSPPADLAPFLRSYFYIQSHAWPGITAAPPHPLSGPDATHKARLPHQYILPLHATMKEVISTLMGQTNCTLATAEAGSAPWFSAADLAVYVNEFSRTGFQGMLNGYRVLSTPSLMNELQLWAGKKVEVPSLFLGGDKDWSLYQLPGALEGLGKSNAKFYGVKIIHNCGHYPHQERPEEMAAVALDFLSVIRDRR